MDRGSCPLEPRTKLPSKIPQSRAATIAGPLLSTYPGMAQEILVDAFVVIVVGGFGSLGGALIASLLIGELQSFGVLLFPKLSLVLIYLLMSIVLVIKPSGLFGEKQ